MTGPTEPVSTYAGQLVRLGQADRFGGVGTVSVRIRATGGALHNPVVEWVRVIGTEVAGDGRDGAEVDLLARAEALRVALAAAPSRPARS